MLLQELLLAKVVLYHGVALCLVHLQLLLFLDIDSISNMSFLVRKLSAIQKHAFLLQLKNTEPLKYVFHSLK